MVGVPSICWATKPCGGNKCRTPAGQFDAVRCRDAADWVAVGSIREVLRHPERFPLNKDLSEFVFVPEFWEKGTLRGRLRFKVGWCENSTEVPEDHSGKFRFYGLSMGFYLADHRERPGISTLSP